MKGSRYGNSYSGIDVVYKRECSRALYGVTFIDHNTGVVLNGSRLGKEYAANAIVDSLKTLVNMSIYSTIHNFKAPLNLPRRNSNPFHREIYNLVITQNNTPKTAALATLSVRFSTSRYCLMATIKKKRCSVEECKRKRSEED